MHTSSTAPLEDLLRQVALGDRAAFEALYRATSSRLFGICVRILADRPEAEDALQDAYSVIWRKAVQFDATRANATSWLATIARNKALDRLRALPSQQARANLELAKNVEDPGDLPAHHVQAASERAALEHCLGLLEPQRCSLIRAAFFDGLTYEELAAKSGAPLGTIKSWIRRGLLQLRECLEP